MFTCILLSLLRLAEKCVNVNNTQYLSIKKSMNLTFSLNILISPFKNKLSIAIPVPNDYWNFVHKNPYQKFKLYIDYFYYSRNIKSPIRSAATMGVHILVVTLWQFLQQLYNDSL